MEKVYLDWIDSAYDTLLADREIPKKELTLIDGGKISIYRCGNVIRCDIKRPETKRRRTHG